MGLRERLRRLELEAERTEAPTWDEYWGAARRERARRLEAVYGRPALVSDSAVPSPGRDGRQSLLADDTPERAEADRRVLDRWGEANGAPGTKVAADAARAKLLA